MEIMKEEEIIRDKREITEPLWGIYFLLKKDKIVYVGESNNCHARIWTHIEERKKDFDSWGFLEEKDNPKRWRLEREYIKKFKPEYNSVCYKNDNSSNDLISSRHNKRYTKYL